MNASGLPRWLTAFPELWRDSTGYALSKAIPGVVGLATVVVFVRAIGPEEYGKYALTVTVVNMASAFFMGWLTQALLRYYGEMRVAPEARRAMWMGLGGATLAGALVLGVGHAAGLTGHRAWIGLAAALALFLGSNVYQLRTALLQAQIQPGDVVVLSSVQALIALLVPVALFAIAGRTYLAAVAGLAVSYGLAVAWRGREPGTRLAGQPGLKANTRRLLARLWRYGWSLSFWFAVTTMLPVSDRFFIERHLGFGATGSYAAVYDVVVRGYSLLLAPITMAVHPRMMGLWSAREPARAWATWRWAMGAQAVLVAVLLAVLAMFSGWGLRFIRNMAGAEAASVALPLLIGGFLWQFALLAHKPLELAGRTGLMLGAAAIALGINVTANALLLPRYGIQVTAAATVASGLAYVCLTLALGALVHRRGPGARG